MGSEKANFSNWGKGSSEACMPPREIGEILDCISRILMVDKEDIDYWKEVNRPSRNC